MPRSNVRTWPTWTLVVPGAVGAAIRLVLLAWVPFPIPGAQDEFSYLLGADTFSHGRLTNPTHPLWKFFETIHVISVPTYASKYPPGQAFFLSIGERVFGHPFFGVVLSYVVFITVLGWMLRAWMPPTAAVVTQWCAAIAFGVGHDWLESYWGGFVAATGAALVLGALGRMRSQGHLGFGWPLSAGIILLWFTRPFEGIFLIGACAAVLALDGYRRRVRASGAAAVMAVLAISGAATLAFQGYYDWRVTGDPLLVPYVLHQRQYDYEPPLWIEKPSTPTFPANPVVRNFHQLQELGQYRDRRHAMLGWLTHEPGSGRVMKTELKEQLKSVELTIVVLLLAGYWWILRDDADARALAAIVVVAAIPILLETFTMDHYMAPLIVATIALAGRLAWVGWGRRWRGLPLGTFAGAALAGIVLCMALGNNAFRALRMAHGSIPFKANRSRIERDLRGREGRQVVFVRYTPQHDLIKPEEWVFNGADIDAQKVVWARDLGAEVDQQLIAYYPGRHFWMLDGDADRPEPVPYDRTLAAQ